MPVLLLRIPVAVVVVVANKADNVLVAEPEALGS
jgi:hypothetical protein